MAVDRWIDEPVEFITTNVVGTCVLLEVDRIKAAGLTDLDVGQGVFGLRRSFNPLRHLGAAVKPVTTKAMVCNQVCRMGGAYKIAWDFETLEQAGTKFWLFRSPSIKDNGTPPGSRD